jgi:hypothetical protein
MGRLLGWAIVALVVLLPIGLMIPEVRALPFKPFDDRPQLDSELRSAIALIDGTIAEVGQGRKVTIGPVNIAQQRSDQGDLSEGVSYDRCDDWKSWFYPGWSGLRFYLIEIANAEDGEAFMADVRAYWESLGYSVIVAPNALFIDQGTLRVDFDLYPPDDAVWLAVGTDCLPDD